MSSDVPPDRLSAESIAGRIRKTVEKSINPKGTLAIILRYLDAKVRHETLNNSQEQRLSSAPEATSQLPVQRCVSLDLMNQEKATLSADSLTALAKELGVKAADYRGKSEEEISKIMINAYITPSSFMQRLNNRHHAALLQNVDFSDCHTVHDYYDKILDTVKDVDFNPKGALAMLVNGLRHLATYNLKDLKTSKHGEESEFTVYPTSA